jgi:hypothetical protein
MSEINIIKSEKGVIKMKRIKINQGNYAKGDVFKTTNYKGEKQYVLIVDGLEGLQPVNLSEMWMGNDGDEIQQNIDSGLFEYVGVIDEIGIITDDEEGGEIDE